jgi:hypothetical protein
MMPSGKILSPTDGAVRRQIRVAGFLSVHQEHLRGHQMSQGFGIIQRWLLGCIGAKPMTFEQILAIAFPEGSYESDMAKALGGTNVGRVRSLRRALRKLCDVGIIQITGRRPAHYRLHPQFVEQGMERNSELIALLYQTFKRETKERAQVGARDGAA